MKKRETTTCIIHRDGLVHWTPSPPGLRSVIWVEICFSISLFLHLLSGRIILLRLHVSACPCTMHIYMYVHFWCMYTSTCDYIITCNVHVNSVNETRPTEATIPEDNSFFSASGRIRTRNILHTRRFFQLSHRGSSAGQAKSLKFIQGKESLSSDEEGNSISVVIQLQCTCTLHLIICKSLQCWRLDEKQCMYMYMYM